jgi:hypothetical protein
MDEKGDDIMLIMLEIIVHTIRTVVGVVVSVSGVSHIYQNRRKGGKNLWKTK